jgi:hypothetical protein
LGEAIDAIAAEEKHQHGIDGSKCGSPKRGRLKGARESRNTTTGGRTDRKRSVRRIGDCRSVGRRSPTRNTARMSKAGSRKVRRRKKILILPWPCRRPKVEAKASMRFLALGTKLRINRP